ncbi:MAG TPA: biotin--[acetyl-CoA-carboxylase] ligase, partial [Acidimicrobiales bacterium]|nr:biotin--[acetyl-CoA-carboxylase] ligase [Acidimicrobiales bacterium]
MSRGRFGDVRRFETIDSTNAYLLEAARAGAPEGVVAVADYQTAGRGRRGRRWAAPPGANLLVSVLLRPALPAELRPIAAGVVALAARDAVQRTCGVELGVKWPNDLVTAEGGKVAGVLAETDAGTGAGGGEAGGRGAGGRGAGGGAGGGLEPAVVVGIGLNCNWPGLG